MMVKISRLLLIILTVFVAAIVLPDLYWLFLDVKTDSPYVNYSQVDNAYVMSRSSTGKTLWLSETGDTLTRDEYEMKLPLFYYLQLISDGNMPESLNGVKLEVEDIKRNRNMHRVRPYQLDMPLIQLFPLLESKSGRVRLEMPDDYFRTGDRIEFISTDTREVKEEKSAKFTKSLADAGFTFPMKRVFGNPTTRKPFDEGYFLEDAAGKLFHLKMVQGEPVVKDTHFPKDVKIYSIMIEENSLKEYYGIVYSEDNRIYFLTYDNYRLQELPTNGKYDKRESTLIITTTMFDRSVSINNGNAIHVYTTDMNYDLIDEYHETWKVREDMKVGTFERILFPFKLSMESNSSTYAGFYWDFFYPLAFMGNLLFLLLYIFLHYRYSDDDVNSVIPEIILIAFTGIYGFIAVMIYVNTPLKLQKEK